MPFDPFDPDDLLLHFEKHAAEFGARTPSEYEQLADAFMDRPLNPPLLQCIRRDGTTIRYDESTEEFGVRYATGIVATYFRPFAAGHLPEQERPTGSHGYHSNKAYFRDTSKW